MAKALVTVIEHEHYLKLASKLLSQEQMGDVADMLAAHPEMGDVIRGTGGIRKVRYAGIANKGKSGGVRVIYFYIQIEGEIHLLDVYGKNEKENLTKEQIHKLAKLVKILKGT